MTPPRCENCGEAFQALVGSKYAAAWVHPICASHERAAPVQSTTGFGNTSVGPWVNVISAVEAQDAAFPLDPASAELGIDRGEEARELDGSGSGSVELECRGAVEAAPLEVLPVKGAELDDAALIEGAVDEPVAVNHDALTGTEPLSPELHSESPSHSGEPVVVPFADGGKV